MDKLTVSIIENERRAPMLFAKTETAAWGHFFYDPDNPLSYASNHAVITDSTVDLNTVLPAVRTFYEQKGLIPRLFFSLADAPDKKAMACLEAHGFTLSAQRHLICMVKTQSSKALPERPLEIQPVTEWDDRITENIIGKGYGNYLPRVLKESLKSGKVCLFAGKLFGEPVSMCALTLSETARLDSVMTGMGFRGCGFASKVVCTAARFYEEHFSEPLYLLTDNPSALPIYRAAGFSPIDFPDTFYQAFYSAP